MRHVEQCRVCPTCAGAVQPVCIAFLPVGSCHRVPLMGQHFPLSAPADEALGQHYAHLVLDIGSSAEVRLSRRKAVVATPLVVLLTASQSHGPVQHCLAMLLAVLPTCLLPHTHAALHMRETAWCEQSAPCQHPLQVGFVPREVSKHFGAPEVHVLVNK